MRVSYCCTYDSQTGHTHQRKQLARRDTHTYQHKQLDSYPNDVLQHIHAKKNSGHRQQPKRPVDQQNQILLPDCSKEYGATAETAVVSHHTPPKRRAMISYNRPRVSLQSTLYYRSYIRPYNTKYFVLCSCCNAAKPTKQKKQVM